jgi:hypothetical protein
VLPAVALAAVFRAVLRSGVFCAVFAVCAVLAVFADFADFAVLAVCAA